MSSILYTYGYPLPFTNMYAHSQPNSTAYFMMCPPKILPWRFISCRCINIVLCKRVEPMYLSVGKSEEFRCLTKMEWRIQDSDPEGGEDKRDLVASYFLTNCLYSPKLWRIFMYLSSASKVMGGAENLVLPWLGESGLGFILLFPTMTKVAVQLSALSCSTSMHTSMLELPTQVTYPEKLHYFSVLMDSKKSILSTAAVTKQQSNSPFSSLTAWQYLYATFPAMQSITSIILPILTFWEQNLMNLWLSSGDLSKGSTTLQKEWAGVEYYRGPSESLCQDSQMEIWRDSEVKKAFTTLSFRASSSVSLLMFLGVYSRALFLISLSCLQFWIFEMENSLFKLLSIILNYNYNPRNAQKERRRRDQRDPNQDSAPRLHLLQVEPQLRREVHRISDNQVQLPWVYSHQLQFVKLHRLQDINETLCVRRTADWPFQSLPEEGAYQKVPGVREVGQPLLDDR